MNGFILAALTTVVIIASACAPTSSGTSAPLASSRNAPSGQAARSSTPSAGASPAGPSIGPGPSSPATTLASGAPLPACVPRAPRASATLAFVAKGHAWAISPAGTGLTCLFDVEDAGLFAWGPLGDRALLGGLEVKGVAGGPSLAASNQANTTIAWSRPTGKTIVFATADGTRLEKVHLDGAPIENVTPLPSSTYLRVAYHPSGEAFAYAIVRAEGQSIWISSNIGAKPTQLVFSTEGTTFGAMGFDVDGTHLLFAAQHADNHPELHSIDITDPSRAPVVWEGPVGRTILDLVPGMQPGTAAWTTSTKSTTSCADRVAMIRTAAGVVVALPRAAGPTQVMGWLSPTQVLVGVGGCEGSYALSAVDAATGSSLPVVSGVAMAAARAPVPTPPAALPKNVVIGGSGFS
jgi:hypothetical protein